MKERFFYGSAYIVHFLYTNEQVNKHIYFIKKGQFEIKIMEFQWNQDHETQFQTEAMLHKEENNNES